MMAKILLVEDNPITKKVISTALVDSGYRMIEAPNASGALGLVDHGGIELVLLDASLPDSDAIDLVHELRVRADAPELPILGLSEDADESRLLSAGFTDVLTKPIDTNRMLSAVRIHLARSSADPPGDGRVLLLVDGNPRSLRLSARRFEQLGFEIVTATDGREALERLEESEPNVIVSELLSDAMDGFELCQAIHARPEHAQLPVVLVSSQQLNQVEREFAARIGARAAVTRTADLNVLVDAVLDALRPRSRRSKSPPPDSAPVSQDYRRHAISTLEHRANLREDLARRDGTLRAVRSVLDSLNDLGGRSRDDVLYRVLAAVLDATGFALGAAYLASSDGGLELRRHVGFSEDRLPEVAAFWGHLPLLLGVMEMGEPRGASASHAVGSIQHVLDAAQIASLILIPLTQGARRLGVLLLGSRSSRLSPDWLLLSETVAGSIANVVLLAETSTQLVETEKRFHGIADSTTEGIVVCDAERQIGYANAALLKILDLPACEVLGRSIDELLPFLASAGENGQGTITRGDGETIPCEATARTTEDPSGRPCRVYVVRDLSERLRLSQVAWLASHDALTGLYNRHRFEEDLAHRLSESRRYSTSCAILLIDIDHFKLINDTYGHQAGDSVLTAIAEVLRKTTRESDVPARLGGDEFIVLLPHAGLDQARACATKLFERVKQLSPTYQGWSLPVSISIGVAAYPQHGEVAEALISSADEALYRAKRGGRNQICVQEQDSKSSMSRLAAASRLSVDPPIALPSEPPAKASLVHSG
jgi:diguanylate cyclase (GGDEF)-like protein/PAS domain S-box-containing protein